MHIDLIDTGHLSSQLVISLDPSDYKDLYNKELKKFSKTAHLKGFRKGKTPLSAIRKMFGKSALMESINTVLQEGIQGYIQENNLKTLGEPIPAEDQEEFSFGTKSLESYQFKFDIGLAPDIDVQGVSPEDQHEKFIVTVDESQVDKEIENLRRRQGNQEEVDAPIEVKDVVVVEIREKETVDRPTWSGEISILVESLTSEYQEALLSQKKDFELEIDIYNFEENTEEDYVHKYFLEGAPEDVSPIMIAKVVTIKRLIPATLDETFFETVFDPKEEIKDLEAAKAFIRNVLEDFYAVNAMNLTKRKIMESLIEKNHPAYPDDFLKRWLLIKNEELTAEYLEEEYDDLVKNLTWTLIKEKLSEQYQIEITKEMIQEGLKKELQEQFIEYGYDIEGMDFERMTSSMMEREDKVKKKFEELFAEEILEKIYITVKLEEKMISVEEYSEILEQIQG